MCLNAILAIPLVLVFAELFGNRSPDWLHISTYLLPAYTLNTLQIIIGVLPLSFIMGYFSAWCVGTFDFWGRKVIKPALMLPIALPTYVAAYAYNLCLGSIVVNKWGIIFIFSAVLYPYVYLFSLATFSRESKALIESAKSLGSGTWDIFIRIQLPMSRPAIFGGLWLVLMDTVNDYGAVDFFGINTITTGVFVIRENFNISDSGRFCAWLILLMFFLRLIEDWSKGKRSFSDGHNYKVRDRIRLGKTSGMMVLFFLLIPITIGFIVPALTCFRWMVSFINSTNLSEVAIVTFRSMIVAALASGIITIWGLTICWLCRIRRESTLWLVKRICQTGYVVPGVVIGISVMTLLLSVDRFIISYVSKISSQSFSYILYGSYFALFYAYTVRFMAMSTSAIDAAFIRLGIHVHEAARSLGQSPLRTLLRVELPAIRPTLFISFSLLFIEIIKELPLTMLMAPPDFQTLATLTHLHIKNEDLLAPAIYTSIIIFIGVFSSFLLLNITVSEENGISESR